MSYQVLALKYRPQTFKDVVGQSHVTITLSNAISFNRVAHAILFTGPRGTGKTTIARILAKAMNCIKGPIPKPCNKCKSCTSITLSNAVDVFEIDGASNNSVDQIRELRENITYLPSLSKFKIYIIDEVHMLSIAAFNALLKTLEEPPVHVLFIFATTEVHKIPLTILSRCQRHDLRRISVSEISDHLVSLCKLEDYNISFESTNLIASEADGSIRDSLSLLDRIISSSHTKEITHENILQNLGIIDRKIIFDMSFALLESNRVKVFELIDKVYELGFDLKKFYSSVIKHFRNLVVVKICGKDTNSADISDHDKKIITSMVSLLSQMRLNQILNILLNEETIIKFSSHTKIAVEMAFLKLIDTNPALEIDEMINKLTILTQKVSSKFFKSNVLEEPVENIDNIFFETLSEKNEPKSESKQQDKPHAAPDFVSKAKKPDPKSKPESEFQLKPEVHSESKFQSGLEAEIQSESKEIKSFKKQDNKKNWKGFIDYVDKNSPSLAAILIKSKFKEISNTHISFELNTNSFELYRIESKKQILEKLCHDFFEKKLKLNIIKNSNSFKKPETNVENLAKSKKEILNNPIVVHALKTFKGTLVMP